VTVFVWVCIRCAWEGVYKCVYECELVVSVCVCEKECACVWCCMNVFRRMCEWECMYLCVNACKMVYLKMFVSSMYECVCVWEHCVCLDVYVRERRRECACVWGCMNVCRREYEWECVRVCLCEWTCVSVICVYLCICEMCVCLNGCLSNGACMSVCV
jgi:hypothetical protein